ncbi:DUF1192 domain-containing protein [Agrobacterium sp. ES01]|uniref:DUF1192 domain-containing protein n=1 Tax=Agrobacterium sp. ES01 TaxID=3420714 RepID=UPI003D14612F
MAFMDEERPKKPAAHELGCDLSMISADELQIRISLLQEEIQRLEAEYVRKQAGRSAAESLFRS